MSWNGLEIVHVLAMDADRCIGANNMLPWHLPADLQHFKAITQHGVIIMGRKTFDSIGRPLPARCNMVLTRQHAWFANGVEIAFSLEDILNNAAAEAKKRQQSTLYIIGGAKIFNTTLDIADRLEVTHIETHVNGDAFYPLIPKDFVAGDANKQHDVATGLDFSFVTYRRMI